MGYRRTAAEQRAVPVVAPASSAARPSAMTATDQMLRLQRLAGNRAVNSLVAQRVLATQESPAVQTASDGLRQYGPDDFTFVKEFTGGSSQPWHVKVGGAEKVFKFVRRRDRTTVRPTGEPGLADPSEQAELKPGELAPEDVMRTEMLTGKIYEAAGGRVLPAEFAWVATGVKGVPQWSFAQITDFRPDAEEPGTEELKASPDFRRDLGLDAVLAIFDLHKPANWLKTGDGMIRQDLGGAMHARAQGGRKNDDDFMTSTDLPETLRGMGKNPASPYKNYSEAELAESLISLRRRLPQERIAELVTGSGLPEKDQIDLIRALNARIDAGVAWAVGRNAEDEPIAYTDTSGPAAAGPDPSLDTYGGADQVGNFRGTATTVRELAGEVNGLLAQVGPLPIPAREQLLGQLRRLLADGAAGALARPERLRSIAEAIAGWGPMDRRLRPLPSLLQMLETQVAVVRTSAQELWNVDPETSARNDDPYATPPLVGPEELLNVTQYNPATRTDFVDGLRRLEGSVLIRRLAKVEEDAFKAAARTQDVDAAMTALFTGGALGTRGEIAFSVNDAYIFGREIRGLKESGWQTLTPKPGYERIVEIPVTAGMLRFLRDYSYVSNPSGDNPKLTPFKGSPNVKFEGGAGGARDGDGIPNVMIKRQGFAQFWSAAEGIRFFDATGYSGIDRSIARARRMAGGDGPVQDTSDGARARKAARDEEKRRQEEAAQQPEADDDLGLGGIF